MGAKMISYNLTGKTALVTGGCSGIGLEAARLMAAAGAKVAINYLPSDSRGEAALTTFEQAGLQVIGAPGDVGNADDASGMVSEAIDRLGQLDLLLNNAGTPGRNTPVPIADLDQLTEELWAHLLSVNLMGMFRCAKAAAPALKAAKGAIVNTASVAGFGGIASTVPYSVSKAGVINLTKNLAHALAPDVRVNAVAPATVDSSWPMRREEERHEVVIERTPLRRVCTTKDVAGLMIFLGFSGSMITGQTVVIDGGARN